jgi:hypothetical protein
VKIDLNDLPTAYPCGLCWCGCGGKPGKDTAYFVATHDRKAESAIIKKYFGNIARFVAAFGHGPTSPAVDPG